MPPGLSGWVVMARGWGREVLALPQIAVWPLRHCLCGSAGVLWLAG